MKKLFFMGALLMAVGTVVPSDNQPNNDRTWTQWLNEKKESAKKHLTKHKGKYIAGAAALALGTAAYLNRDKFGAGQTGKNSVPTKNSSTSYPKALPEKSPYNLSMKKTGLTNEQREEVRELDRKYEQKMQQNKPEGQKTLEHQKAMREINKQYSYRAGKKRQRQRMEELKERQNSNTGVQSSEYLFKNREKRKEFALKNMTPEEKEFWNKAEKYGEPYTPYSPSSLWQDIKTFLGLQPNK